VTTSRSGTVRTVAVAVQVLGSLLAITLGFAAHELEAARRAGSAGERALSIAHRRALAGDPSAAHGAVLRAADRFEYARAHIGALRWAFGRVPVLGAQLRAMSGLAEAGAIAAHAGLRLVGAVPALRIGAGRGSAAIGGLRHARKVVSAGVSGLDDAIALLRALGRGDASWPVAGALAGATRRLSRARAHVVRGGEALGAAIAFLGGDGPRRYLVLSQNPDELRPTGGFIGTYGVLDARAGRLRLERYNAIEAWFHPRPWAVVAPRYAPRALRLPRPPVPLTIANVNATADWPTAARLARKLWLRGGESPVDGVISLTPDLLARVVGVLGPLRVRGYNMTLTSRNLVATLDLATHGHDSHRLLAQQHRKHFIAALAVEVMRRLTAHPQRALRLVRAIGRGLDAREGMAWSRDRGVQRVIRARGWDGTLPSFDGDFAYDAEFEYAAKNGRAIRRRFDHDVVLRADGSGRVTTTVEIVDGAPAGRGIDTESYITLYGPAGATLDPASDPPIALDSPLAGHPAVGWLRAAKPRAATTLRVVWNVPRLLSCRPGGRFAYRLLWRAIAAHRGDVLHLRVTPPPGWRWVGRPPPTTRPLRTDVRGTWLLRR
jgi:hypothetical protein